jgi:glycerophosphoryl diester phosphodiesterase
MTRSSVLPLIIGHRGSAAAAPENTIAAFKRALRDGADGLEFDVRLARDEVPVVIHDATLQRTAHIRGAVSDFTGQQLGEIEVGSWFNRRHPAAANRAFEQETIPSLQQLFEMLVQREALLYLELKTEERQANALAGSVVALIKAFGFVNRVIVECFDLPTLAIIKALEPSIHVAPLFDRRLKRPLSILGGSRIVDQARQLDAAEIALHRSLVRPALIARATTYSLPIVAWTVDNPGWLKRAISMGLKGLITNDPDKMIQARSRLLLH